MVDQSTGTIYYDCPGYSNLNNFKYDISFTYIMYKLLKFANSVKLLFTVNYSSVTLGTADRHDFLNLVQHTTLLMKNIENYRDGIALVVNKVEYNLINANDFVDDANMIEAIAQFLYRTKHDLKLRSANNLSTREKEENEEKMKFIEILLEKKDDKYTRITILRLPEQLGSVRNMTLLQSEKDTIKSMIAQNLQYVKKVDIDEISHLISDDSKSRIRNLIEKNRNSFANEAFSIDLRKKPYNEQLEKKLSIDPAKLYGKLETAYEYLSEFQPTEPKKFLEEISSVLEVLNANVAVTNLRNFLNQSECLEFIKISCNWNATESDQPKIGIPLTIQYLNETLTWYRFLLNLNNIVYEYDFQDSDGNDQSKPSFMSENALSGNETISFDQTGLQPILDNINKDLYHGMEKMKIISAKLQIQC